MRVVVVSTYFAPAMEWGGPVASLLLTSRALAAEGVRVDVATTDARPTGRTDVPVFREEQGVRVHTSPVVGCGRVQVVNRYGIAPGCLRTIARLVNTADVVAVQGFWGLPSVTAMQCSWWAGRPFVVSPRGNLETYSLG